MSHYYTENAELTDEPKQFSVVVKQEALIFATNSGVFSKNALDYGTRKLMESIDFKQAPQTVIDMGCGYGAIGIFLAKKFPEAKVQMYDVNERALELAKENVKLNGVDDRVMVEKSDLFMAVSTPVDMIVSNPPIRSGKQTIFKLYEEANEKLNDNGTLYVVIQKKQGAPSTLKKLNEIFNLIDVVSKSNGYWVIKCTKRL